MSRPPSGINFTISGDQIFNTVSDSTMSVSTQAELLLGLNNALHTRDFKELEKILNTIDLKSFAGERFPILHRLFSRVCPDARCQSEALRCTELLIEAGVDINLKDSIGHVPLYLAVRNQWNEAAGELLKHGADTTVPIQEHGLSPSAPNVWNGFMTWLYKKQKMTLATFVILNAPDVFLNHLNRVVDLDLETEKMRINFSSLVQSPPLPTIKSDIYANATADYYKNQELPTVVVEAKKFYESKFLYHISRESGIDNRIFQHPVIQLFVRLKYIELRPQLIVSMILHVISIIGFTTFIVYAYAAECQYDDSRNNGTTYEDKCTFTTVYQWLAGALVLCWFFLVIPELFGLYIFRRNYITKFSVPWIVLYVLWLFIIWPAINPDDTELVPSRYPYAAVTLFLIWGLFILQMSKIGQLALYCEMFIRVAIRIVLLTTLFIPLFIGFILSLVVMGSDLQASGSDLVTLFSQIVGGPDFESIFQDRDTDTKAYMTIAIIIYIAFVLLLCIVFLNFLLALTTGDLPTLWSQAQKGKIQTWIQEVYLYDRTPFLRSAKQTQLNPHIEPGNPLKYIHEVNLEKHPRELINELRKIATVGSCESHKNDSRNISQHLNPSNVDIIAEIAQIQETLKLICSQRNNK